MTAARRPPAARGRPPRGSHRANLQASFPPAVRAAVAKYGAGKSALEQAGCLRLNQQRQLKNTDQKNTQHPICVASAAVSHETGNFKSKTAFEGTPHRACLKAFFEGIPVPVRERE